MRTSPETGHVLEVDTVDIPDLFTHCFIVSRDQPLWQVSARHDKGDTESRESGDGHSERASERNGRRHRGYLVERDVDHLPSIEGPKVGEDRKTHEKEVRLASVTWAAKRRTSIGQMGRKLNKRPELSRGAFPPIARCCRQRSLFRSAA